MRWFLKQWMVTLLIIATFCYVDSRYYLQSGDGASPVQSEQTDSIPSVWTKPALPPVTGTSENGLHRVLEGVVNPIRGVRIE